MFERVTADDLASWVPALARVGGDADDAGRIDLLRTLEEIKCAAEAAQARITVDFEASQRQSQADAGLPARRQGEGIAEQVGLARRQSPHRGSRLLGLAKVLSTEMPHTFALMTAGLLSEWRASLLARETALLTLEQRRSVDAALCRDPQTLEGLSDAAIVAEAKRLAHRLDPTAAVRRARRAEAERHVSIRPAPDTMSYVTALLPVGQGVAVFAALKRAADQLRATGDDRSRGQIMADTLVTQVTGQAAAPAVPVEVRLVMTDRTLIHGDREPAVLEGYGVVPAGWARDLADTAFAQGALSLRRLYTAPHTGELIAMDSRARVAPKGLGSFIDTRDQVCRTPWCGAPIRHHDHPVPHDAGGRTTATNQQGLCERCNHAKQAPGWRARPSPGARHTIVTTTPTGHRYTSTAPPPPGAGTTPGARSRLETYALDLVLAA
ncbi:HNH endonuclease signature motif containing protein [Nocardioides koreensis]|uniref:HNH endonuclease signature motif containing protein n=1 Tax=Nocardioides koreensis TaxID=433651 RepID=A0ABN2ZGH1_9ACTN